MLVYCADGTCVRVRGIPYTIRLELPVGNVWGDEEARQFARELNRRANPFRNYDEKTTCRRQGCTCQHARPVTCVPLKADDEEDEEEEADEKPFSSQPPEREEASFLNTAPCILQRYRDWAATHDRTVVHSESAHVEPGYPLNGYWENPRSFLKMRLTKHHFITDVQRELERVVQKNEWPCEVAGVQGDAVTAFLYATVELSVRRAKEAGLPIPTQAFGIGSMRWITIPLERTRRVESESERVSTCKNEYVVDFEDLVVDFDCEDEEIERTQRPLRVMSFDIETLYDVRRKTSSCRRDPILMISMTYGPESNPCEKTVCLTWGDEVDSRTHLESMSSEEIAKLTPEERSQWESMRDLTVLNLASERSMLLEFARAIREIDPDVLTGYNVVFFDMSYIIGRCEALGIEVEFMSGISRRREYLCSLTTGSTFTNQGGGKRSFNADIPGRVFVDMLPYIRSKKQFRDYKLDTVSAAILKISKFDMPYERIGEHFYGGKVMKRKLVEYCTMDSVLVSKLMMVTEALNVIKSESKVFGVTMRQRLGRGLQMQLARIVEEFARPRGINLPKHVRNRTTGEFVIPFHDRVRRLPAPPMRDLKVVDKRLVEVSAEEAAASGTTTTTTSETKRPRLIQSTIPFKPVARVLPPPMTEKDDDDDSDSDGMPMRGNHGNVWIDSPRPAVVALRRDVSRSTNSSTTSSTKTTRTTTTTTTAKRRSKGYKGGWVIPIVADYYSDPVISLDFASLYPSIMRAYNLCPTTLLPSENDVPESKKFKSVMGYEFVRKDTRRGLLPAVLESLLHKRDALKREMKKHPKRSQKWTVLDGMQSAVKICMNSIYGGCGAATSVLSCVFVAETVTASGRQSIMKVFDLITARPSPYPYDLEVIGGDTDSTFVRVRNATLAEAMELGPKLERAVNKGELFEEELQIAFECVIWPSLFRAKKSAIGWKHEPSGAKPERMDKGWVSVRRDNSPYVAKLASLHADLILRPDLTKEEKARRLEATTRRAIYALLRPRPDEKAAWVSRMFDESSSSARLVQERRAERAETSEYRVPLEDLMLSSNFTRPVEQYANPDSTPHIRVVQEWAKRDATTCPQLGDRIPYLYVHNRVLGGGAKSKVVDGVRAPFLVKPEDVNYQKYFERLKTAIEPIVKFFITDERRLSAIFNVSEATMTDAYVRGFEEES